MIQPSAVRRRPAWPLATCRRAGPDEHHARASRAVALACRDLAGDEARSIDRRVETIDLLVPEPVRRQMSASDRLPRLLVCAAGAKRGVAQADDASPPADGAAAIVGRLAGAGPRGRFAARRPGTRAR